MATKNTKGRFTEKRSALIRTRALDLIASEMGPARIVKDKMQEEEYSFIYPIDEFRSLAFRISVTPVANRDFGMMAQLVIQPGKPPK